MCGLCGTLGGGVHWADGLAAAADDAAARREARREHVRHANRALRPYGLTLADWHGASFVLRSRTGAAAIVRSLGELWVRADALGRTAIDPLDPALLDRLDRRDADDA